MKVAIPGAPNLLPALVSLQVIRSHLAVLPIDPRSERLDQVATIGAGFSLTFPVDLAFNCFGRRSTCYAIEGSSVGSMCETHGAALRDGIACHEIRAFTLDFFVDDAASRFGFEVQGVFGPPSNLSMRQLSEFTISATLPLERASEFFYRVPDVDERLETEREKRRR